MYVVPTSGAMVAPPKGMKLASTSPWAETLGLSAPSGSRLVVLRTDARTAGMALRPIRFVTSRRKRRADPEVVVAERDYGNFGGDVEAGAEAEGMRDVVSSLQCRGNCLDLVRVK